MHVKSLLLLVSLHLEGLVSDTRASNTTHGANMTFIITQNDFVQNRTKRFASVEDDNDENITDEEDDEVIEEDFNSTEPGSYLGGWCQHSCSPDLLHVYCDSTKKICVCEKKYPVRLAERKGCAAPKLLGDQCFFTETCAYYDSNAICAQVGHKALCACRSGYHTVGLQKGVKREFCSEDVVVVQTSFPSLLVVASGIAVLSGLLCFVLRLFSSGRYGERGRYADANIAPPLLFSSDNQWINGIPLTVHGRPSSRTSSHRSSNNISQYRSKGVLVSASRAGAARAAAILLIPCHLQNARTPPCPEPVAAPSQEDESPIGSRRPSISSVHSNASSHLSYSQKRFEMENQQREQRRVAREEATRNAKTVVPPTPSPISTDHLLPSCEELNEEDPLGVVSSALSISSATTPGESSSLQNYR